MPIPAFEPSGFLPAGRHAASPAEFHASLVAPFPSSVRRPAIHAWWERHLASLRWLTHVTRQWIGGSFVSEKPEPADIDVCTFMDGPSVDALPPERQDVISFMTSGKVAQGFWHCDSYPVLEYPPSHPTTRPTLRPSPIGTSGGARHVRIHAAFRSLVGIWRSHENAL